MLCILFLNNIFTLSFEFLLSFCHELNVRLVDSLGKAQDKHSFFLLSQRVSLNYPQCNPELEKIEICDEGFKIFRGKVSVLEFRRIVSPVLLHFLVSDELFRSVLRNSFLFTLCEGKFFQAFFVNGKDVPCGSEETSNVNPILW